MVSPDACARRVRSGDGELTDAGDLAPTESGSAETGPAQLIATIALQSIAATRRKSGGETLTVAYVVEPIARRYLREGSLKWLLFLYYPKRASLAPKLRAFIDVAKKTLKSFG